MLKMYAIEALMRHNMKFLDVPQSGSIAGTTHSHNRAGQYTRNRRSPVQPIGTGRRAFIRSAFASASSGWSTLTPTQQAAWTTYADGHPITDSLGQSIKLTGHQMYVSISTQLLNCAQTPVPAVPAGGIPFSPVVSVFTAVASTGVVTITLDGSGDPGGYILVSFARPQGPGRTQVSAFWQADVLPGDSVGNATEGTKIIAQFGVLSAGNKLFMRLTPVYSDGVTGTPVQRVAIIS